MKKILYFLLAIPALVLAQSTNQNYIKSTTYKQATTTSVTSPDVTAANVQVIYFDGLGRPIQQIANAQSNTGKDIVTHIEYDAFGRQIKEYLPYVNTTPSLNYNPNAGTEIGTFYNTPAYESTLNPYNEKLFEASPLNRVLKQAAPGAAWALGSGHEIKLDYQTNTTTEVKYFKATASWNSGTNLYDISITDNGNYQENQLYKTVTKDENWTSGDNNTTQEFKNKEGQVVLKRTFGTSIINGVPANTNHDTFYVYDQFGNFTYVLPPLAEGATTLTVLDGLCYQYKHDYRNRMVAKKIPGKQWEYIVYDKLDRPVATGPAFSPWGDGTVGVLISEYDVLGRVTQTGWKAMAVSETSRSGWQTNIMAGTNPFVLTTNDILTKNYYDNYTYPNAPTLPTTLPDSTYPIAQNVKGLATGSWVRVLTLPSETNGESSYVFYDDKYRPVRTYTMNHLGGFTQVDSNLDFIGKTLYTITRHKRTNSDTEMVVTDTYTYTDQDRLLLHKQQVDSVPEELIASNTYDELGQLISKRVGGIDVTGAIGLQKVDYTYNIRGWLKSINDINDDHSSLSTDPMDLFDFKLSYQDNDVSSSGGPTVPSLYNGNISESYWRIVSDNIQRKYAYTYDPMNRLLNASFSKPQSAIYTNSYMEDISYDKNGNIQTLLRNGGIEDENYEYTIDALEYKYEVNTNKLLKVFDQTRSPQGFNESKDVISSGVDTANDYTYDANGNMTKDDNKGINSIIYNHLNLPTKIVFTSPNKREIEYIYDALGKKVAKNVYYNAKIRDDTPTDSKIASNTSISYIYVDVINKTDYLDGGFQYKNNVLQFFPQAEGYVNRNTDGTLGYVFNYTDHLGNTRLSYQDADLDGYPEILEENNYYPFGLKHEGYNNPPEVLNIIYDDGSSSYLPYKYRFQGQERQDELGLNWDSFKYRNYDYAIGRFMSIDPLAEVSRRWSPYNYCYNNPLRFIDPDGMMAFDPGKPYKTLAAAAHDFAQQYNGISIINKVELKTAFYKMADGQYSYTVPEGQKEINSKGENTTANIAGAPVDNVPAGTVKTGDGHTHSNDEADGNFNKLGPGDSNQAFKEADKSKNPSEYRMYISTPNGSLLEKDPYVQGKEPVANSKNPSITTIATDIPSDKNSDEPRLNQVSAEVKPNVMPKITVNGELQKNENIKTTY